jgi:DNA (cytosine-5)-methyltransferase 1
MGVPQKRERVFFVGLRKDIKRPLLKLRFNEPGILYLEYKDLVGAAITSKSMCRLIKSMIPSDKSISDINKRLFNKISGFNNMIIKDRKIFPTILAGGEYYRQSDKLLCTTRDVALASTFPMDYSYLKTKPGYLVGMSVPPVMIAQIASKIKEQWFDYA